MSPGPASPAGGPAAPGAAGAVVLFAAGGRLLALPQGAVRAVLPLARLDSPPGLPAPLAGFLNLHGQAVPVLALAPLLGLPAGPPHPYRHLLLLAPKVSGNGAAGNGAPGDGPLALLVDRATDTRPAGLPLRPAGPDASLGGLVTGILETGAEPAPLLDPARLLLAQEAAMLESLTREARARLARWDPPAGPRAGSA